MKRTPKKISKKLTSVELALKKFLVHINYHQKVEQVSIEDSISRVLAENLKSELNIPSFNKSSMDGFAVKSIDTKNASKKNPVYLKIKGKIFAGDFFRKNVNLGESYAISTGGPIPPGADSVIKIEDVKIKGNQIIIFKKIPKLTNVALKGEEVKKGQIILKKGTWVIPQDIGLIASIGKNKISVFKRPKVGILATGNELIKPGLPIKEGKIFESSQLVVSSLVKQLGGEPKILGIVKDDKTSIKNKIKNSLNHDLLFVIGGSSVGERDFVPEVIDELGKPGVIVRGIAMKPGSPAGLGIIKNTPIIVCPGFPVSGFFACLLFGSAVLRKMLRTAGPPKNKILVIMEKEVNTHPKVTNFVRVKLRKTKNRIIAKAISSSDSRLIITLTESDGFIATKNSLKKGQNVMVNVFRNFFNENI